MVMKPMSSAPMTPAHRVAKPRISATPIRSSPLTTRKFTASTRAALVAIETQKSWVGLTIAPSAEPGSVPAVPNCRNPAAENGLPLPAKSKTFSRPAYRNPAPSTIRSAARPFALSMI